VIHHPVDPVGEITIKVAVPGVDCVETFEGPLEGIGELVKHLRVGTEVGVRSQHGNVLESVVLVRKSAKGGQVGVAAGFQLTAGGNAAGGGLGVSHGLSELSKLAGRRAGHGWYLGWLWLEGCIPFHASNMADSG